MDERLLAELAAYITEHYEVERGKLRHFRIDDLRTLAGPRAPRP